MDRNQFIGLILMLVFITVYFQFFAPDPVEEPQGQPAEIEETLVEDQSNELLSQPTLSDSAISKLNEMKFGLFSQKVQGQEEITTIENEDLIIDFSNKGGVPVRVELKDHKDYLGNPLVLVDNAHTEIGLTVNHLSKKVNLSELYFESSNRSQVVSSDTATITYQLILENGSAIEYLYRLPKSGFVIDFEIRQTNLVGITDGGVNLSWKQKLNRVEKDFKDARNRSTVKYRYVDGDVDELSATSTDKEEEALELGTTWVSFRQKFFTSALVTNHAFSGGRVSSLIDYADTTSTKEAFASLELPMDKLLANQTDLQFYFGPNNYAVLKEVAPDFEENVDLGWSILAWINKFAIIPIFHFLEKYIANYGIIIIIMVFILKLVLSPLTYKSHLGMAKMKVMKPELDELKEKHGDDMQKAQQEQMALYQKVGINPLSGCIPMLLQMPILFAMFYFFPNSIELRQKSFLWAHDLSTFDSILDLPFTIPFYGDHISLFTLLMTASTILYTWSNSQVTTVQGPMKSLQYVMPIMFLFFLNSYSSGLTFYYFVSNIVSFGQIALFRKFIDEEKIKKVLDENRKKNVNKKKSKFQQRLDEAMKASQQAQKNKKKKK